MLFPPFIIIEPFSNFPTVSFLEFLFGGFVKESYEGIWIIVQKILDGVDRVYKIVSQFFEWVFTAQDK